jgi:putative N6-adenine-specific DNA methylase
VTPAPSPLDCFAIVAPGLEAFAMEEARALGIDARAEEGGFAWTGDVRSVMLANLALRIPSRVVVRLATFDARSFAELERRARKVDWTRVLRDGDTVRFRVTSRKSKLYHTGGIAQRLGESVTRVLPHVQLGVAPEDDEEASDAAQLIVVRFVRDHCTVSADTSGALLHRRGYRQATAKAPLRETIAAAMLHASGWRPDSPLVDPFCGAGTIPIEAALLARHVPPGSGRTFAIEHWPNVSKSVGALVREQLAGGVDRNLELSIEGSDRDAGAIAAARANAERAGVSDAVELAQLSVSDARFVAATGWVVSNPPYGVRVGEADRVRDLWGRFGRVLRERASGWTVVLLSPDPALDRQLGFPVRVLATTSNGGIPVRIIQGTP